MLNLRLLYNVYTIGSGASELLGFIASGITLPPA